MGGNPPIGGPKPVLPFLNFSVVRILTTEKWLQSRPMRGMQHVAFAQNCKSLLGWHRGTYTSTLSSTHFNPNTITFLVHNLGPNQKTNVLQSPLPQYPFAKPGGTVFEQKGKVENSTLLPDGYHFGAKKGRKRYPFEKGHHFTVLVKSFAHLNQDFLLASLEERGKLWKLLPCSYSTILKVGPPPPGWSQKIHEINV